MEREDRAEDTAGEVADPNTAVQAGASEGDGNRVVGTARRSGEAVGSTRDLDVATGHVVLPDRPAP